MKTYEFGVWVYALYTECPKKFHCRFCAAFYGAARTLTHNGNDVLHKADDRVRCELFFLSLHIQYEIRNT